MIGSGAVIGFGVKVGEGTALPFLRFVAFSSSELCEFRGLRTRLADIMMEVIEIR